MSSDPARHGQPRQGARSGMGPAGGRGGRSARRGAERIGIFGGTFDPPHLGHLVAALWAREALELERVLFVVANDPWQKSGRVHASAEDRFAMTEAACRGVEGLEPSRIEIDRGGPSYTVDTVAELRRRWPRASLWLVVGSDVAASIATWHRAEALAGQVALAVVGRPRQELDGVLGSELHAGAEPEATRRGPEVEPRSTTPRSQQADRGAPRSSSPAQACSGSVAAALRAAASIGVEAVAIEAPVVGISSSEVRRRLAMGRTVRFVVPDPVIEVIERRGLYGRSVACDLEPPSR
jgi:nicotinate-nucleotide adenylyltransferase